MTHSALVLFAHGARDPRWAEPFQRLRQLVQAQRTDVNVELAFLELMEPGLPELVQLLVEEGCRQITVVPIFFGQGGHVLRDLPVMMDQLRTSYPGLALQVVPAVGEDAAVLNAIASYCLASVDNARPAS